MPHYFAPAPNAGVQGGFDLDRDGRFGEAEDAKGFGDFPGQGGMAILSTSRILSDDARDFSAMLWSAFPWAALPQTASGPYFTAQESDTLPLHPIGAWAVPVALPGGRFWVLAGQSAPPVFDGPENRNGLRNANQAEFWRRLIAGDTIDGWTLPEEPFAYLGGLNADPLDGEGASPQFFALLEDKRIQDPRPEAKSAIEDPNPNHRGAASQDTARWRSDPGPGSLRVDYIFPSARLTVRDSGVYRPALEPDPERSRHFLVWADILWQ